MFRSRDRLSGSLDNSQKLQTKIKQTEQQLLRLMDSDSEIYRSQSPITNLCHQFDANIKTKYQKRDDHQTIKSNFLPSKESDKDEEPSSFQTSNALSNNPFTNNWKDYDSNFQRQSYFFNSTPSFTTDQEKSKPSGVVSDQFGSYSSQGESGTPKT